MATQGRPPKRLRPRLRLPKISPGRFYAPSAHSIGPGVGGSPTQWTHRNRGVRGVRSKWRPRRTTKPPTQRRRQRFPSVWGQAPSIPSRVQRGSLGQLRCTTLFSRMCCISVIRGTPVVLHDLRDPSDTASLVEPAGCGNRNPLNVQQGWNLQRGHKN